MTGREQLENALAKEGIRWETNVPLSRYTTFRIGGPASLGVFPVSEKEFCRAWTLAKDFGIPCFVVGNGSDLLADDAGYPGAVFFTGGIREIAFSGTTVTAGCGVSLSGLSSEAYRAGLAGLAFAYGIPGSVGGALYMNAGAYGGEIGAVVSHVTVFDTETKEKKVLSAEECGFSYRNSVFMHKPYLILSASFSLTVGDPAEIRAEMDDHMSARKAKQPLEYPSAGSAFKRYPGYFTAQLIDEAGFKGVSVGGAQVSEKHAGFIVNRGGATAEDVRELIRQIKEKIREKNHIDIECEIIELK